MARLEMPEGLEGQIADAMCSGEVLFELGLMYCNGREVATDLVAAHKWFNLAAMRGNQAARDYRRDISREMSASEIAEAQRQARTWLTTH